MATHPMGRIETIVAQFFKWYNGAFPVRELHVLFVFSQWFAVMDG
jgi:hypothetical protein